MCIHVSVCAAQLSHWQGTVAAQTNEQLRERILFEKPGSSVTNLFSSLQDKKSQPPQTITNYPKFYSTKSGHDRFDKYEHCQNTPKPSETETIWNSETMQWLPELRCGKASWTSQSLTRLVETEFEDTLAKRKVAYMSDLRTLLGQTDMIRVRKWKSYRLHSTMILFHVSWIRLIASTLIFVWVVQPLELFQVLTGWGPGATWSSSSQKDQLLRGIRGIARLGLRRLSGTVQGPSWVSVLQRFAKSVYSSCLLQGTRHEQL